MTQEQRSTALALPDETSFRRDIQAINKFQQIVHATMVEGQDYGVIPGTQKPTLLKPGAEKIAKLLGLADTYEILDRQEDWGKPFFRYMVKCKLISVRDDVVISEGLGECNSMESKYRYRWIGERDLPGGIDKLKLVCQERHSKTGGHWLVYRFDNEDIFSQVNTILKMAKKRALVDAALSAGRLSNVFTQDMEDIGQVIEGKVIKPDLKQAEQDSRDYFPPGGTKSEPTPQLAKSKTRAIKVEKASPAPTEAEVAELAEQVKGKLEKETKDKFPATIGKIDRVWLIDSINKLHLDLLRHIKDTYHITAVGKEILFDVVGKLSEEQQTQLTKEIQDRLDLL